MFAGLTVTSRNLYIVTLRPQGGAAHLRSCGTDDADRPADACTGGVCYRTGMRHMPPLRSLRLMPALLVVLCSGAASADDAALVRLTFRPQAGFGTPEEPQTLDGKIVTEASDGGLVFLDRSGRLWLVPPANQISQAVTGKTFTPFSQDELAAVLRSEFGPDVTIVTTKHYVLCSEAGREYALWAGRLFERLMGAFETFWDSRQMRIGDPEFPLVAIILKDKTRFAEYALTNAGPSAVDALGYYSKLSNRVVMYDLTANAGGTQPQNPIALNRQLAAQIMNVSTIVHEATHQIAFNCGMHARLADNPFWLVEGMAMFFETPDLKNANGWRTVGQVNGMRLRDFKEYATQRRRPTALHTMLTEDGGFQVATTALDNYAEAWALNYYLIKTRRADYIEYLQALQAKLPLMTDDPQTRLEEFEAAFGPPAQVEREMMRYLSRLR